MNTTKVRRLVAGEWAPLRKGTVHACVCDQEGCCSMMTVLDTEENILEIYQASTGSLWSCVARIVLPQEIALCRQVRPAARRKQRAIHTLTRRPT